MKTSKKYSDLTTREKENATKKVLKVFFNVHNRTNENLSKLTGYSKQVVNYILSRYIKPGVNLLELKKKYCDP